MFDLFFIIVLFYEYKERGKKSKLALRCFYSVILNIY